MSVKPVVLGVLLIYHDRTKTKTIETASKYEASAEEKKGISFRLLSLLYCHNYKAELKNLIKADIP